MADTKVPLVGKLGTTRGHAAFFHGAVAMMGASVSIAYIAVTAVDIALPLAAVTDTESTSIDLVAAVVNQAARPRSMEVTFPQAWKDRVVAVVKVTERHRRRMVRDGHGVLGNCEMFLSRSCRLVILSSSVVSTPRFQPGSMRRRPDDRPHTD
ncbi:hypothetical protein Ae201684_015099 [Aphanomyces euteiches]|uniref:Uncharacterized protein n=1 Tax=Aphanomyces euteiches TaxID=100861 RepID=A0A6G0WHP7_9STRA|nr:hypothetical protein Ae201684_015099 [Aphanomyces euteiches]